MAWVRCTFTNLPNLLTKSALIFLVASHNQRSNCPSISENEFDTFSLRLYCHSSSNNIICLPHKHFQSLTQMRSHPHQLQDIHTFWVLSVFVFPRTFFSTSNLFSPSQLLYLDIGLYIRISYISFFIIRHMLVRNYEGNYINKVVKF